MLMDVDWSWIFAYLIVHSFCAIVLLRLLAYKPFLRCWIGRRIVVHRVFCGDLHMWPSFVKWLRLITKQNVSVSLHSFDSSPDNVSSEGDRKTEHYTVGYDPESDVPYYTKIEFNALCNRSSVWNFNESEFFDRCILNCAQKLAFVKEDGERWRKGVDVFFGKRAIFYDSWFVITQGVIFDTFHCWHHDPSIPFVRVSKDDAGMNEDYFIHLHDTNLSSPMWSFGFWVYSLLLTFTLFFLVHHIERSFAIYAFLIASIYKLVQDLA